MCTIQYEQRNCSWGKEKLLDMDRSGMIHHWVGGSSCGGRHAGSWSDVACAVQSWTQCQEAPAA